MNPATTERVLCHMAGFEARQAARVARRAGQTPPQQHGRCRSGGPTDHLPAGSPIREAMEGKRGPLLRLPLPFTTVHPTQKAFTEKRERDL